MIYQGLRAALGPRQLPAEPSTARWAQSRRDLPFVPLPTANKAGPHEHTVNVSSTRGEMLSAGK